MGKQFRYIALIAACSLLALSGCDHNTRHMVISTIFDGVPSLPPPDQQCEDYAMKKAAEAREEVANKFAGVAKSAGGKSVHPPYEEKNCDGCHDKNKEGGLIRSKDQLCFVCHTDFFKGPFVHGPASVGDCLACHVPHDANFPKLLKTDRDQVCGTCHREKRIAAGMHDKVKAQGIACPDCHDPHSGNSSFFLK